MVKRAYGGLMCKGRKRIEKGQPLCLVFKVTCRDRSAAPCGLEKQFLSDSFLIKKKDIFFPLTMPCIYLISPSREACTSF